MIVKNPWTGYITRTYEQIKNAVLAKLPTFAPEITDHTDSNPLVRMLSVWAGIAEMLGYYIDTAAREAHLPTARLYKSAVKIAKMYDYRIGANSPASVDVTFTLDIASVSSATTIPQGTHVQTADGIDFYTVSELIIPIGQTQGTVAAKQYTQLTGQILGASSGGANQTFDVGTDVVHGSISITVDLDSWSEQPTLAYSFGTDKHYIQQVDENKSVYIEFGDDISGAIPTASSDIVAAYQTTLGAGGNVGVGTVTTIIDSITLPGDVNTISVSNSLAASGGSGVETLEELKVSIPKAVRTRLRAVTTQDYIDVTELYPGVARAGVDFDCGKTVDVYIVPDGGGIASGSLISDVGNWLDDKRMITTTVRVLPAGEVTMIFEINLVVLAQYTQTTVVNAVKQALEDFLSLDNQTLGGKVALGDIYEVVEGVEGVKNSEVVVMKSEPYARAIDGSPTLNWTVALNSASDAIVKWDIVFTSASQFQLKKDGSYVGTFNTGVLVSRTEVNFTIVGTYALGNKYVFYTYPYFGTIDLAEPSLPVTTTGDVTINATGGIV